MKRAGDEKQFLIYFVWPYYPRIRSMINDTTKHCGQAGANPLGVYAYSDAKLLMRSTLPSMWC